MNLKHFLVSALCVLCVQARSEVCTHPTRGETRRISLDEVARAQEDVKRRLAWAAREAATLPLDASFESGLPACTVRRRRSVAVEVPKEGVGRTVAFAPEDRMVPADVRVATRAKRIAGVAADALADRALVERLGVRCAPTLVILKSEVEIEVLENP